MAIDSATPLHQCGLLPNGTGSPLRGILLMCGGFIFYAISDTLAKLLTQELPPLEVAWFRLLGLLGGVIVLLMLNGPVILRSSHPLLQIGRGMTAAITVGCFITAVAFVPLADAVAVSFVAPFIVTILAAIILRERVGPRRWAAVTLGFIGTLIVIRPGLGVFHPAILLVICAGIGFAVRQVLSRYLSGDDPTATTVAYTAIASSTLLLFTLPFVWVTPSGFRAWLLIAGMASLAGLAEYLIIRALEITQAVILAPLQYSLMIWSTLLGWLVFNQLPDLWTWVGATIIVGSGLYAIYREAVVSSK